MKTISIKRSRHRLLPDGRRVLAKSFVPGDETLLPGSSRAHLLLGRIHAIPEAQVGELLAEVLRRFESRHHGFSQTLERNFELVSSLVPDPDALSFERR